MTRAQLFSGSLILSALTIVGSVGYLNSRKRSIPIVFSAKSMLAELWNTYKRNTLEPGSFRTLDKQKDNITTSEGESYTMLRAVWEDDKPTFDISLKWTRDNLKRPSDSLPSWLYGERPDGTYGILTNRNGQNTASDADTDMALSLIFAGSRWNDSAYLDTANFMVRDIWRQDVVIVAGKPVMTGNNQEQFNPKQVIVNPSYFAPYAYSIFARIDPTHDWLGLRTNMYSIVDQASAQPLDAARSANIPPDWIALNRSTGVIMALGSADQTTHFSYDAMRLPFRLALDYEWNKAPEAKLLLAHFGFLDQQWKVGGKILTAYDHLGAPVAPLQEAPAIYGGTLGYFISADPAAADQIYIFKLRSLYDPNKQSWTTTLGYYDDNWAWFGMALYLHQLPNLAAPHA